MVPRRSWCPVRSGDLGGEAVQLHFKAETLRVLRLTVSTAVVTRQVSHRNYKDTARDYSSISFILIFEQTSRDSIRLSLSNTAFGLLVAIFRKLSHDDCSKEPAP